MAEEEKPKSDEGLDDEIEFLRSLMRQAAKKLSDHLSLDDLLKMLDTVGRTSTSLSKLLKDRRELENEVLNPSAMLRQALLELEEEWPELKALGEQFSPKKEKPSHDRQDPTPDPH